jgi:hypothetical protein
MVEVPVREQKRVDARPRKMVIRALRGVDQHMAAARRRNQKTIRIQDAAGKFFELNHGQVVFRTCVI